MPDDRRADREAMHQACAQLRAELTRLQAAEARWFPVFACLDADAPALAAQDGLVSYCSMMNVSSSPKSLVLQL